MLSGRNFKNSMVLIKTLKDPNGWANEIALKGFRNDSVKRSEKKAKEDIYSALDQGRCISVETTVTASLKRTLRLCVT